MRILWAAIAMFVLASSLRAQPVTQLKVLSFNIWVQGGLSLSNCIEVIRTSGADVVGLQECNAATAQTIAGRLGFQVQPDPSYSIVSRYPILGSIAASGGRGCTIEIGPGQRVHFFNCHLTAYPYGPYDLKSGKSRDFILAQENSVRMPALSNLLAAMAPFLTNREPCFLTGDFNAPSHLDYTDFPWPTSIACTNAGLGDSYHQMHPTNRRFPGAFTYNEPGITWTPRTQEEPNGVFDRIDFVHYSLGDGATPTQSIELDGRNSISPWPSDHRAVLTTFTLTPPPKSAGASVPNPPAGADRIALNATLSWLSGSNAISHQVYFGTNQPPPSLTNVAESTLILSNLHAASTYFWRVDELTPSGVVTGEVWSFTTRSTNVALYEWTFSSGDLIPSLGRGVMAYANAETANLTTFGTTDGATIPHIAGHAAKYLRAPAFAVKGDGYRVTFPDTGPNGGGSYVNQYTLIFDFFLPNSVGWLPFFNTNPDNANDADFFVTPLGGMGIGAIGYSGSGLILPDTWNRVAFVADLAAGLVDYYLNGTQVLHATSVPLDGRHSLYSNADPGADLLLFNEGNDSGMFTHEVLLSSFLFIERALSASEVMELGSAKARGIMVPPLPLRASITLVGTNVMLRWDGDASSYQVEETTSLQANSWRGIAPPTVLNEFQIPLSGSRNFFRVVAIEPL